MLEDDLIAQIMSNPSFGKYKYSSVPATNIAQSVNIPTGGEVNLQGAAKGFGTAPLKNVTITAGKTPFRTAIGQPFINAMQGLRQSAAPMTGKQILKAGTTGVAGKAIPLFALLDVATELVDEREPFQKNLAQGLGSAGGSLGGAAAGATVAGPLGAVIGALLMSPVGRQLAEGAYKVINPRGQDEYDLKQIERKGEKLLAQDAILRQLALRRAQDQQDVNRTDAMVNYLLR